jgi:hypothetical protein
VCDLSDERIQAIGVGGPPPTFQEIFVADYDPEWPRLFGRAEEQIPTQDDG